MKKNSIKIVGTIDYESSGKAAEAIESAADLCRMTGDPLTIEISSPGGSLDGMSLILEAISEAKSDGVEIETIANGTVASAAVPIFLTGDKRTMKPNARFMVHAPQVVTTGGMLPHQMVWDKWMNIKGTENEDDYIDTFYPLIAGYEGSMMIWRDEMIPIITSVTKIGIERLEEINSSYENWWLTRQEAIDLGFSTEEK